MSEQLHIHTGGCHCRRVQFAFEAPKTVTVQRCNCSMCAMTGFLHLIVPAERFTLQQGEAEFAAYRFNSNTAKHLFCKQCGVKSFYVPRSNPNGYSINMNCVDRTTFTQITTENFDGQNWEENARDLAHLA